MANPEQPAWPVRLWHWSKPSLTKAARFVWRWSKPLITLAVLVGVGYALYDGLEQLGTDSWHFRPEWLLVAGLAYLASMTVSMCYWWWSMVALGQQPRAVDVARAYFIGHLGKYVPGKALVIIMRAGLVQSLTCRPGMAAVTVVYETLSLMAAGAVWLVAVLCWTGPWEELPLWQTALVVGTVFLPTVPRFFNVILRKVVSPFRQANATALPRLDFRFFLLGILFGLGAWLFMGMSLAAAILSVNDTIPVWSCLALVTAQFAAATIIGWIVPTPGGLGAREGMVMYLLTATMGKGPAALVAILLRLTWIVTELAISGALYPLRWVFPRPEIAPLVETPIDTGNP
jgi:hypothetical protein